GGDVLFELSFVGSQIRGTEPLHENKAYAPGVAKQFERRARCRGVYGHVWSTAHNPMSERVVSAILDCTFTDSGVNAARLGRKDVAGQSARQRTSIGKTSDSLQKSPADWMLWN